MSRDKLIPEHIPVHDAPEPSQLIHRGSPTCGLMAMCWAGHCLLKAPQDPFLPSDEAASNLTA